MPLFSEMTDPGDGLTINVSSIFVVLSAKSRFDASTDVPSLVQRLDDERNWVLVDSEVNLLLLASGKEKGSW